MDTENMNFDLSNLDIAKLVGEDTHSLIVQNSPTIKINIEEDNVYFVTGFNMLCMPDKLKYDLKDIKHNTILIINSHHMVECLLLITGGLHWFALKKQCKMNITDYLFKLKHAIGDSVTFYYELTTIVNEIINNITNIANTSNDDKDIKNIKDFMTNIWFLPYGEIDKMKDITLKELEGGIKNE